MKLVITEGQYKKLQKHLRRREKLDEVDFSKFRKGFTTAALGAGLAGSVSGQDIEPTGKWEFGSPYSKEKITVDTNTINFKDAGQVEDIMDIVFNQGKFFKDSIELNIDYRNVERLRNLINNRPDLRNQMISDIITPEVINDLRNQFSQMIIDSSRFGGQNVRGMFEVPKGYEGQQQGFKLFVQGLKGMFGPSVVLPIKNVVISDRVLKEFLYKLLTGKYKAEFETSAGPGNKTLIHGAYYRY
jgi:hypothetical protein